MSRPPEDARGRRRTARDDEPTSGERATRRDWSDGGPSFVGDDPGFARRRSARRAGRGRGRRRLVGYTLLAVFAFIVGLGVGYARGYFASSSGATGRTVTVIIPPGATLDTIAGKLEAEGVVRHARAFVIRVESDGHATDLKPGTYRLHENEPYARLVAMLVQGVKPPTIKVAIPEGTTLRQTATLVAGRVAGISAHGYVRAARDDPPQFKLQGYKPGTTLEGMLFPATYEVRPGSSAAAFVDQQLTAFRDNFATVDMTRALKANLTPYDVVTIASMIDREAQVPAERALVAAVIWNRLRDGMLLQIDATIQYALGKNKPVLTYDDLKIDSPYNTYKHAGLPPTPISNPGLAALRAAADPAAVDYLYYVARNDGTGRHYFSQKYAQFLLDKAKAQANGQ